MTTGETPPAYPLPVPTSRDEARVERDFWKKLLKVAGQIPFAEDAAAAYFCATDPATPARVKAILFAALAYFVMPFDLIPDFFAGIGYTDDAAIVALAIGAVANAIKDAHRAKARHALGIAEPA